MSCRDSIKRLNQIAASNEDKLKKNPFSNTYSVQKFVTEASDYGRPPAGSKTDARGRKAGVHVCREVLYLCELIDQNAEGQDPNKWIKFGKLFTIYSYYSDKLVGMLIRARKYGLLHFEGEMLYQRQDDNKNVTMLMSLEDIRNRLRASGDPAKCIEVVGPPPVLPPEIAAAKAAEEEAARARKAHGALAYASLTPAERPPARRTRHLNDPLTVPPAPSFCIQYKS